MTDERVHVRVRCNHPKCAAQPESWEGEIYKYQVGLLAIWFHSFHEGHKFSWWEDGQLVLGQGDVREG